MFKNALVTVFDKTGLYECLKPLVEEGMRVVSTGGTAEFLKSKGLPVTMVEEQTGFPEILSGRVKTLHPLIHIPLLARKTKPADQQALEKYHLSPFDLVICNLYPFDKKTHIQDDEELVEWIDVGGPSLLRAAAKNFQTVTVLSSPEDYSRIKEGLSLDGRKRLAAKVFKRLSHYDSLVAARLTGQDRPLPGDAELVRTLRYGENPGQKAEWYKSSFTKGGLHQAECLQGRELSFNNLLDLEGALSTLKEFNESCCVSVKHNNPCGVACGNHVRESVVLSLNADPLSVFGGIVAVNQKLDKSSAEEMVKFFLEVIIAPDYSEEALDILSQKPKLRVLKWPEMESFSSTNRELREVSGGILLQDRDKVVSKWNENWKIIGEKPNLKMKEDLLFAWKVCAHLKSNAIALTKKKQTVGLGMGQVNRVSAVEQALSCQQRFHPHIDEGIILASDGFFPFPDSIERAAQGKVQWIIQPGGSIKDKEAVQKAKDLGLNMVLTGQRHFKH
ncbi:MAG: bifunctional phosphoribosylaminoimidazolecarboxamide formyltransferase/IMP cyclohydrolase [Bdellovibrionales bacterium]|nr:bifunctional phosphoribosylaminoimidazolecarboxamide formyltransferase/IMP cyclohydrolase [Bdellovibrionales bacterium]